MKYTLFGSKTSPFVRRIRILMEKIPHEFKEIDIFGPDAELLKGLNPIHQIPVLLEGDKKFWDSRIIFNYLNLTHRFQNMDWEDENLLTGIDGAMTSAVSLLLMKRSGINTEAPSMYIDRQKERIESILDFLKPYIEGAALKDWNFHTISIYCFLDWATFRGIVDISNRPECQKLLDTYADRKIVQDTQIPKA